MVYREYPQMLMDRPNPIDESYRRLWAAVINQAEDDLNGVHDWQDHNGVHTKRLRYENALAWFKNDRVFIGSFVWICDILKLDPVRIRERVLSEPIFSGCRPSAVGGRDEITFQSSFPAQALGRKQRQVCRV